MFKGNMQQVKNRPITTPDKSFANEHLHGKAVPAVDTGHNTVLGGLSSVIGAVIFNSGFPNKFFVLSDFFTSPPISDLPAVPNKINNIHD